MKQQVDITINDGYMEYFEDNETDVIALLGGASSGKSYFVIEQLVPLKKILSQENKRVLIVRKVARTIKKSVLSGIEDAFNNLGLIEGYDYKINRTDYEITLLINIGDKKTKGNKIYFAGMDDRVKIKSIKGISDIVMEEAAEFDKEDYDELTLRLRDINGVEQNTDNKQMILMFNPETEESWTYKLFEDTTDKNKKRLKVYEEFGKTEHEELIGRPKKFKFERESKVYYNNEWVIENMKYKVYITNYRDNKFLSPKELIKIEELAKTNPDAWRRYALGLSVIKQENVIKNWKVGIPEDLGDWNGAQKNGLDFGFAVSKTAGVRIYTDEKQTEAGNIIKRMYIEKEYMYSTGLSNNDIAYLLKKGGLGSNRIICDSAEPDRIAELKKMGINAVPVKKGAGSKYSGIDTINEYEKFVNPECENVIYEFKRYKHKVDKNGNILDDIVDKDNHIVDAIVYAERKEKRVSVNVY